MIGSIVEAKKDVKKLRYIQDFGEITRVQSILVRYETL